MSYGEIDLGQHGLFPDDIKPLPKPMLTYINGLCVIHMGTFSEEILMISFIKMSLKMTCLK